MDPAPRCPACDAALPADPRPPRAAGARLRCDRCGAGFGAPEEPAARVPVPGGGTPAQAAADATSGNDAATGATCADAATAAAPDAAATDAAGAAAAAGAASAQAGAGLAAPEAGASVASAPAPAAIDAAPPHDGDDDAREPVAAARSDGSPGGAPARADAPAAGPTAAAATEAPAAQPAGADAAVPGDPDVAGDALPPAAPRDPLPPEGPSDLPVPPPSPDPPGPPGEPDFVATEPPPPPLPLLLRPAAVPPHGAAARTATAASDEAALLSFLAGEPATDRRWQHPALQPALAAVATLLALALAAQAALHWRDALAAARPGLRPAIEALCLAAGCSVGPLRRLDDVSVEGSEWNPSPSGGAAQLVVVLRNAGDLPLALPWVELTLTEVNGALLARRALAPGDFGAAATLAPAREAVLRATLAVDGRPPAGYTVELFHP